jgi:hypothetical protein
MAFSMYAGASSGRSSQKARVPCRLRFHASRPACPASAAYIVAASPCTPGGQASSIANPGGIGSRLRPSRTTLRDAAVLKEIVPVLEVDGRVVGTIDVESDRVAAFGPAERGLVERCAKAIRLLYGHG